MNKEIPIVRQSSAPTGLASQASAEETLTEVKCKIEFGIDATLQRLETLEGRIKEAVSEGEGACARIRTLIRELKALKESPDAGG